VKGGVDLDGVQSDDAALRSTKPVAGPCARTIVPALFAVMSRSGTLGG
jgi:hypothetical protein